MTRPSWDEYFIGICKAVAKRSHDKNTQVGCVIVDEDRRIVSTGYNGFPPGVRDDIWPDQRDAVEMLESRGRKTKVTKYDVMLHAEINAIAHAGRSLKGCTMYCYYMPCHPCAMAAIAAGIKKIVYVLQNPRTLEKGSYDITEALCAQAEVALVAVEDK